MTGGGSGLPGGTGSGGGTGIGGNGSITIGGSGEIMIGGIVGGTGTTGGFEGGGGEPPGPPPGPPPPGPPPGPPTQDQQRGVSPFPLFPGGVSPCQPGCVMPVSGSVVTVRPSSETVAVPSITRRPVV